MWQQQQLTVLRLLTHSMSASMSCSPQTTLQRQQQQLHDSPASSGQCAPHMTCVHVAAARVCGCRYIDYMRLVLGSKARELYQSLDVVLEPQKPGKAAAQQVSQSRVCVWCA